MPTTTRTASHGRASKKSAKNTGKTIAVLFVTLFIMIGLGISTYTYYILNLSTFYKGIYIDGTAVEGLTAAQVVDSLRKKYESTLDSMNITVSFEDKTWEYDHNSIKAAVDIQDVVEEAYQAGRQGSIISRLKEIMYLGQHGKDFKTTLTNDTSVLRKDIQQISDELYVKPADADIIFNNKKADMFTFTPEVIGRQISVDEIMAAIKEKTDKWDFTPYVIKAETLLPKYTLEEVKTWTSKIATYETVMAGAPERTHNITLSSSSFDGIRIEPGQEFSLNEATGPRGLSEGYKNAPVIVKGVKLVDEPGGGNCQTSTTFYGALVRADLEIIERWNHSWPSSYTETGQDAMVDYPNADLKFRNNKDTAIFVSRTIKGDKITVDIYGKKSEDYDYIGIVTEVLSISATPKEEIVQDSNLYKGESVVEYKSRPNIKAQSYRVYYKDGKEVKRVKEAYSNYRMVTGKIRVGTKPRPVVEQPSADDNQGN